MRVGRTFKRIAAALLTAVLAFGMSAGSYNEVFADYSLDSDDFQVPETGQTVIYLWQKGMPPADGNAYTVLLAWKSALSIPDCYWKVDNTFVSETTSKKYGGTGKNWGSPYMNSTYCLDKDYGSMALTSTLNFDYGTLKSSGKAYSLSLPDDLPSFTIVSDEGVDGPGVGLTHKYRVAIKVKANRWLVGQFGMKEWITTWLGLDDEMHTSFGWNLDTIVDSKERFLSDEPLHRSYSFSCGDTSYTRTREVTLEERTWEIRYGVNTNKVYLRAYPCDNWDMVTRISGSFSSSAQECAKRMKTYESALSIVPDKLGSGIDMQGAAEYYLRASDGPAFEIYWAEPVTVFYVKNDITVVDGQVSTLDGPMMLTEGKTITVKDGGVLSLTGWIMNNGKIVVEPGGTLLLQKDALITTMNTNSKGKENGGIQIDGNAVVMSGAKMSCGGVYGLRASSTANILNYGAIIAQTMILDGDYILENRGDDSYLFPGWLYSDSGFSLLQYKIDSGYYPGIGRYETTQSVNISPNAVTGTGKIFAYPDREQP